MKIVFTNGCYDVLHRGHLELFKYSRSLGDKLIVAIDSDERIKESKGESRPIQDDRKFMLESIKWVDEVYIFNTSEELKNTIRDVAPDFMVIGSDWRNKPIIGSEHAKELRFFEKINGYSTTKALQAIIDR